MLDPSTTVQIQDVRNRGPPVAHLPDQQAAYMVSFTETSDHTSVGNVRKPTQFLWVLAVQHATSKSGRVSEELDGCWMTESVAPVGQWVANSTPR